MVKSYSLDDWSQVTTDALSSHFDQIIDCRSPAEFAEDHIPGAINLPVLSDEERAEVGTIYKQASTFEARRLGASLVSQNVARHLDGPLSEIPAEQRFLLYCWRGGQRSRSFATILDQIGWDVQVVDGGWKAYRSHVVSFLQEICPQLPFIVITGCTGAGKTLVLQALKDQGAQCLDLEGLAHHKGSIFGGDPDEPQPPQKLFETRIAEQLASFSHDRPVFVESESAKVGKLNLPEALWTAMKAAPALELDVDLAQRASFILRDYADWVGDAARVEEALERLTPRHGHETIVQWIEMVRAADWEALVTVLLAEHYDPLYRSGSRQYFQEPGGSHHMPGHDSCALTEAAEALVAAATMVHPKLADQ